MLSFSSILFLSSLLTLVNSETISYRARILPISNNSSTPANGFVTIFTDVSSTVIGYAGIVQQVEPNLLTATCNATNGCGVHIHSGRSCYNSTLQGGHYFNNLSVPIDPWINERYSSDDTGKTNFQSIIQIGTIDIEGRAFVGTFDSTHLWFARHNIQYLYAFTHSLTLQTTIMSFISSSFHEWYQNWLWNY